MAEVDPVILQLRADVGKYRAELLSTTSMVVKALGRQERQVQALEKQFRASSASISGTLKGLTASFVSFFSAQQVVGLIDSYTRFQNQLRVAGKDGEALVATQDKLLAVAQRYGVELETLGNLYGGLAQAQADLGANEQQMIAVTQASAQALKITGKSTIEARGAILGLVQALASGIVRAEEFNQINEGGLRPLLQAVAASEKYGGSVAKLRIAIVDGQVTSEEFFRAILSGSDRLEGQAAKAALTLSGAFTKLTNAMTVYVGQSAEANGATTAVAGAMELLANNLDTVADALAVIAAVMLGRFAAGMVAGAASTGLLSSALFAVQARAIGAATTMEALKFAGVAAGRSLLAVFGGPVGLAVAALTLGLGYLATQSNVVEKQTSSTATAISKLNNILNQDPSAKVAKDAAELAKQRRAQADATFKAAAAEIAMRQAMAQRRLRDLGTGATATVIDGYRSTRGGQVPITTTYANRALALERGKARAEEAQATRDLASLKSAYDSALKSISSASGGGGGGGVASTGKPKKVGGGGAAGPSAEEIEADFNSDLRRIKAEQLQAELQITTNA